MSAHGVLAGHPRRGRPLRRGAWIWALLALMSLILALLIWPQAAHAQAGASSPDGQLAIPPLSGRVIDQTGTLTTDQQASLSAKLAQIEAQHGSQVVVLIIATLQGEDIATYAYRVADQWKIGRKEVGDGVLLVVAKDDHRLRIEVAKALEGAIPDLAASQIMDRYITPAFKAGDFAGGISLGVDALAARIAGENLPAPQQTATSQRQGGGNWQDLGIFLFMGVPVLGAVLTAILGRKAGSVATGLAMGALGWWVTTSLLLALGAGALGVLLVGVMGVGSSRRSGWGSGPGMGGWGGGGGGGGDWGGGSSGGGFSSGGGGDFGGGGASGRW